MRGECERRVQTKNAQSWSNMISLFCHLSVLCFTFNPIRQRFLCLAFSIFRFFFFVNPSKNKKAPSITTTTTTPTITETEKEKNRNKLMSRAKHWLSMLAQFIHSWMSHAHSTINQMRWLVKINRFFRDLHRLSVDSLVLLLFFFICTSLNYHSWTVLHNTVFISYSLWMMGRILSNLLPKPWNEHFQFYTVQNTHTHNRRPTRILVCFMLYFVWVCVCVCLLVNIVCNVSKNFCEINTKKDAASHLCWWRENHSAYMPPIQYNIVVIELKRCYAIICLFFFLYSLDQYTLFRCLSHSFGHSMAVF